LISNWEPIYYKWQRAIETSHRCSSCEPRDRDVATFADQSRELIELDVGYIIPAILNAHLHHNFIPKNCLDLIKRLKNYDEDSILPLIETGSKTLINCEVARPAPDPEFIEFVFAVLSSLVGTAHANANPLEIGTINGVLHGWSIFF